MTVLPGTPERKDLSSLPEFQRHNGKPEPPRMDIDPKNEDLTGFNKEEGVHVGPEEPGPDEKHNMTGSDVPQPDENGYQGDDGARLPGTLAEEGLFSLPEFQRDNGKPETQRLNRDPENGAVPIKNMAEIEESTKLNEIKIGTIYTVSPAATMRKVYSHYGIVTDIKENGIEIFHLNKEILNKYGTKVFVAFSTGNDKIFNFDRGVKFFPGDPLTEDQIKYMRCRMEDVLSKKHIPYGLKYKDTYNCESLVSYIKTGQKNISSQVFNFENKFGKIGSFIVSNFDKVMIVTNKLGYIKCYFDNEKKND